MKVRLTLVSSSPRRKDLLAKLDLPFDVAPSTAHERWTGESPEAIAKHNALNKVKRSVHYGDTSRVLLGADTLIHFNGQVLGKPSGAAAAERMLRLLSGNKHEVITGYCVTGFDRLGNPTKAVNAAVVSKVFFYSLGKKDVRRYITHGEWRGKAGGYAIQGEAGKFVESVEGDYENVIGLPVEQIRKDIGTYFSDCDFL